MFWNENLVAHKSQHRWWESDLGQASILDQSGKRNKVVHATRKHPLVPNSYLPGMSLTYSTLHLCTYIQARCILLSAVSQVLQVFVLYVGVCFIFGKCTKKKSLTEAAAGREKKALRGSDSLDLPWMLLIGPRFFFYYQRLHVCVCVYTSRLTFSRGLSVLSPFGFRAFLFWCHVFQAKQAGKIKVLVLIQTPGTTTTTKCWY